MPENPAIAELLELARIDGLLVKYRKRALAGPQEIAQKEAEERAAQKNFDAAKDEVRIQLLDGNRHALEAHTAAAELAQVQQRLRNIKNNAEYNHLTERQSDLRAAIDQEESAVLQGMETLDRLQASERERLAALEAVRSDLERLKADVAAEAGRIREEQRNLKAKRDIALRRVDEANPSASAVYDTALRRTRGDAMAVLADGVCQACFRNQSPSVLNAILLGTDLRAMVCPGCGRILRLAPGDDGFTKTEDG